MEGARLGSNRIPERSLPFLPRRPSVARWLLTTSKEPLLRREPREPAETPAGCASCQGALGSVQVFRRDGTCPFKYQLLSPKYKRESGRDDADHENILLENLFLPHLMGSGARTPSWLRGSGLAGISGAPHPRTMTPGVLTMSFVHGGQVVCVPQFTSR